MRCVDDSGLSPATAELCYLKKAATLDMYGVDSHDVLVSALLTYLPLHQTRLHARHSSHSVVSSHRVQV